MKNKYMALSLALVFALVQFTPVFAEKHHGDHGKKKKMPKLHEKVFHKAHFILKHGSEIGLTEEQIQTIFDIKFAAKKSKVKHKAEAKVLYLDILRELKRDPVDQEKINALIDQKYEVKKAFAKGMVSKYIELKSVVTPDQMKELKEIWKSKKD